LKLTFADWLQEHGDATRAALIREPFGGAGISTRTRHYRQRLALVLRPIRDLIPTSYQPWLLDESRLRDSPSLTKNLDAASWYVPRRYFIVVVRHGFISDVGCRQRLWLQIGPQLVRRQPVRDVRFSDVWPNDD